VIGGLSCNARINAESTDVDITPHSLMRARNLGPRLAGRRARRAGVCFFYRAAFADDQLSWDGAGLVAFELKTPWRDGTTHLEMKSVDFMERLAARVPRPRLHLIRFHGFLAPNAKLRALVIPRGVRSICEVTELSEVARHRHAAKLRCATSWLPPARTPTPTSG
jgi:hypothetical protein